MGGIDWRQLWEIVSAPDNVPIVALLFLVPFYAWYGLRQAAANDRLIAQLEADPELRKTGYRKNYPYKKGWEKEVHTWPYLMRMEFLAAIIVTIILTIWSLTLNAPLEELANPHLTMNPAKAPWYFLGLQEMLVYFDPWIAGVVMPTLIIIGLMVIPYIDANPLGAGYYTWKQRRFAIGTFCFGFIFLWLVMVFIGTFIRGPGWVWFWPGQTWDPSYQPYAVNRDLYQVFPFSLMGIQSIGAKTIFGVFAMGAYVLIGGYLLHKVITAGKFNRKIFERMSLLQYVVMLSILILMLFLPVKMILRDFFNIKYIWVTPWFNV